MEQITTVGIDLAKNVFSLHGVDANGKVALRRTVRRGELAQAVAALPPCVIGMKAQRLHLIGRREGYGERVVPSYDPPLSRTHVAAGGCFSYSTSAE